jgi:HEAT repeat protein
MAYKITIRELQEANDLPALQHILRLSVDPQRRADAARALGKLLNLDATQGLMRAFQEDEDESVHKAALQALQDLLGNQAEEAIAVYQQGEEDEDGEDPLEGMDPDEQDGSDAGEPSTPKWDSEHMHALVTLAKASPDAEIRYKAVQELAILGDVTALNTLFSIALWSSERKQRDAASQALMDIYGDDYPSKLESHRSNQQAMEEWEYEDEETLSGEEYADLDEEAEDEEDDTVEMETPAPSVYTGTPVMQEERSGTLARVLVYLAVIVITLVVLSLVMR